MPAYIGVNGKAKAIAKVYKGNSEGKAEMIWGPKGIIKYAKGIDPLSVDRKVGGAAITSDSELAIFLSGIRYTNSPNYSSDTYDSYVNALDEYTSDLVHVVSEADSTKFYGGRREGIATATVGEYTLFAGGKYKDSNGDTQIASIREFFHYSGFQVFVPNPDSCITVPKTDMVGVTVGSHAIFAGGYKGKYAVTCDNNVITISDTLTISTAASLSAEKAGLAGSLAANGKYALFAGGQNNSTGSSGYFNDVELYDSDLVKTQGTPISQKVIHSAACSNGDYTIVMGGYTWSPYTGFVDVYDKNMTKSSLTDVHKGNRSNYRSSSLGEYMVFGQPWDGGTKVNEIDVYDGNLTHTTIPTDENKYTASSLWVTLGKYIISAGGQDSCQNKYVNFNDVNAYYLWE